jgi:hypothetical protein
MHQRGVQRSKKINNLFEMMGNFNFDENNLTTTTLPLLSQCNIAGNGSFFSRYEERRNTGIVEVAFFGESFEYTQLPTTDQLRCLEFINENQEEILNLLFEYTRNTLYPVHIGYIGDDEISFPKLNGIEDLWKALRVRTIYIWQESKDKASYCGLSCYFSGDVEHGTIIIMHKFRILGWEEDLSKEKVSIDLKN